MIRGDPSAKEGSCPNEASVKRHRPHGPLLATKALSKGPLNQPSLGNGLHTVRFVPYPSDNFAFSGVPFAFPCSLPSTPSSYIYLIHLILVVPGDLLLEATFDDSSCNPYWWIWPLKFQGMLYPPNCALLMWGENLIFISPCIVKDVIVKSST